MLKRLKIFEEFCKDVEVGEFNIHVWTKSAQIYAALSKQGNPVGTAFDGDVFIAAYCAVNDYILVTNNKEHFKRIDGLQLESWTEQL